MAWAIPPPRECPVTEKVLSAESVSFEFLVAASMVFAA
jgi:hypothetical protein